MKTALKEAIENLTANLNAVPDAATAFVDKEDVKQVLAALCTKDKTEYFYTDSYDEEGFSSIAEIMERLWDEGVKQPFTFNVCQYNMMDKFNVRSLPPTIEGEAPMEYEVVNA